MAIDLGPHAGFIIAAYAVFFIAVLGLIVWVVQDGANQRRLLAELEARGVRRRSEETIGAPATATEADQSGSLA